MKLNRWLCWSMLGALGGSFLAGGCSDDDTADGVAAGAGGAPAGSAGIGGRAGAAAAAGNTAGAAGVAGSRSSAGTGGGGTAGGGASSGGIGGASDAGAANDAGTGAFTLSSPAFTNEPGCGPDDDEVDNCDLFPNENTGLGDSENISPALDWSGAPSGTESFAIALHDLVFAPGGEPFTHWVMWNIPGSTTSLPASLPAGASPGVPDADTRQVSFENDNSFTGSGACGNVYEFVLYALDTDGFDPANPDDPDEVQDALDASNAVLDTATLRARSDPAGPCN